MNTMRNWMRGLLVGVVALGVSGCSVGALTGAPTPEPWSPPPTSTPAAVAEPTAAPDATPVVERETVLVQRGSMPDVLVLNGQVSPQILRELAFRESGVLRTIYAEPGLEVTAGALLAELDLGTLPDQLREARIVAEQDQVTIAREVENGQLGVRRAEIALEEARARLDQLKTPASPTEISRARAEVQQADAALSRTRNDASAVKTRAERAYQDAVTALQDLEKQYAAAVAEQQRTDNETNRQRVRDLEAAKRQAETQVALTKIELDTALGNEIAAINAAQATVDLAQANLTRLLSPPDRFELADAERAVRLAEVQLTEARQSARPNPDLTKRVAASQLAVKEIESRIEARRIYAPFSGKITAVEALPSFPVQAEIPIIALMDGSGLEVTVAGVSGPDAERLTVGTTVALRFARYPDQTVLGTITRTPSTLGSSAALPVFHISYDSDLALTIGDQARVSVDFGERTDVLWLPPAAVRRDTSDYVILLDGDAERRIDVVVGTVTPEQVEIRAGLSVGDTVVLPNQ
jgi:multidrug efflux pump subunit AcrA (membrane-fusion protein)